MAATSLDDVVHRLRDRGVRVTGPRRAVVQALLEAGSHVTAERLLARVHAGHPEVSASSVYRTMDLLSEVGVVRHVHLGHGPAEYHLTEEEHAHLVCDGCGQVAELAPELSRSFVRRVRDRLGFQLELGHFALTGRCDRCAGEQARTRG